MAGENPYQPLVNEIVKMRCSVDKLIAILGGQPSEPVTIIVQPPRSETALPGRVTIGTTATLIRAKNVNRLSISIVNGGAATVYLGVDTTVTTNTGSNPGYELLSQSVFDDDSYIGDIYGIVAAGTITVTFWEE